MTCFQGTDPLYQGKQAKGKAAKGIGAIPIWYLSGIHHHVIECKRKREQRRCRLKGGSVDLGHPPLKFRHVEMAPVPANRSP